MVNVWKVVVRIVVQLFILYFFWVDDSNYLFWFDVSNYLFEILIEFFFWFRIRIVNFFFIKDLF